MWDGTGLDGEAPARAARPCRLPVPMYPSQAMPPAIVFHPDYTAPLPPGHRFPIGKFGRIKELLLADAVIGAAALRRPEPVTEAELCHAHHPDYVATILNLALEKKAERRLGLPLSAALVQRGRAAVGGTLLTARLALEDGLACNIAGGSHHAFPGHGAGFCIFNDVAVTIEVLRRDAAMRTALVIDCDVHQGDGVLVELFRFLFPFLRLLVLLLRGRIVLSGEAGGRGEKEQGDHGAQDRRYPSVTHCFSPVRIHFRL